MLTISLVLMAASVVLMAAGGISAVYGMYAIYSSGGAAIGMGVGVATSATAFLVGGLIALLVGFVTFLAIYANRPEVSSVKK